ncbi:MAG: DNA translocase FtsK, partial [Acidaminococcaceae bacterium]|nr:DNA translocase FtsK [Acidaminococcaceae bacterium]
MLASLVLTGKLSVAAVTAKAGDKIQDIRSVRRERRNAENDSGDTGGYIPRKQESRPLFSGTDTEGRKSSPLDVYNTDEFAGYNDDLRKPSAFRKILNFGQKALDRNTDGTDPDNTRPDATGSENYVPVERMANHDRTEKERPSLVKIHPEQQETRVLRPASGIITGHTDNPEPAPWEKGAIIPGQEFRGTPVSGYGEGAEETPAGTEISNETLVPEEAAPGKPRFILTPNGVTQVTDGSAKAADSKGKVSRKATAGSDSNEKKEPVQKQEEYIFPPLELLNTVKRTNRRQFDSDVREQCRKLEQTLADFRVNAKVIGVTRGPSVTRYELEPAPGVKVSSVVNLADDIALRLAAPGVRVEAPIPGKAAIGIEAPNITNDMVSFREIVDCEDVRKSSSKLCVGLGKDIEGKVITIDLAKMPHLLVAGTTGSGKSVCVNTLLAGIMYKARPDEVKLILVDPKVVELTNYNGIPHLLVPVVTDAKKAASALHWAVGEMERRYKSFADTRVRDIKAYNAQAEEKMPYIVIVIDEMSDLMMVAKADVEDAILRLAQKARACGIHMVLATQRPSVDVITGIVKANIPSRIAFAVSSLTDSRTILDMGGAEKLLGKGDMLDYPIGANKPSRVQGAFVSD